MKKFMGLILLIISPVLFAQTKAFNITLNKTTAKEMKKLYSAKELGKGADGFYRYAIAVSSVEAEGLEKLLVGFDEHYVAGYIVAIFNENQYDELREILKEKYKLKSETHGENGCDFYTFESDRDIIFFDNRMDGKKAKITYLRNDVYQKQLNQMQGKPEPRKTKNARNL